MPFGNNGHDIEKQGVIRKNIVNLHQFMVNDIGIAPIEFEKGTRCKTWTVPAAVNP